MLLAMSFNAYLFVCIVFGYGIGNVINNYIRHRDEKIRKSMLSEDGEGDGKVCPDNNNADEEIDGGICH